MEHVSSSDGIRVALHDLGGLGPPLLLAHATGFHGRVFEPLVGRLTERHADHSGPGLHVWGPDLRGHGDTAAPEPPEFGWDSFADDVLAVAQVLAQRSPDEPLVGLGHSKGAASLLLAEQRAPGTFAALYVYEPVVFPEAPFRADENPLSAGALRRRRSFASRDEAYENYAGKPPFDALHPDALRAYVDHGFADDPDGGVTLKCAPEHEAQVYRMGAQHHAFAHLGEVRCPVVVARGNLNYPGPAIIADAVADALPHGQLHLFDDLGHFGPLEDPARIADDLLALITSG